MYYNVALLAEKKKDFPTAMERYTSCLNQCNSMVNTINSAPEGSSGSNANNTGSGSSSGIASATPMFKEMDKIQKITFLKEVRGEVMLRIAMLKKEMGAVDQAMQMCNTITSEPFSDSIRANALCLKVRKRMKLQELSSVNINE